MRLLFYSFSSLLLSASLCFASPPTNEEMTSWLNKNPDEVIKYQADNNSATPTDKDWDVFPKNISFYDSDPRTFKEIFLTNKQHAYLVPISLNNRGRNSMFHIALVIPEQQKVIPLLDSLVKEVDDVQDLNADNISEIIIHQTSSGGGSECGTKAIIQLNENGTIKILHSCNIESNKGMFGENSSRYFEKNAKWEFIDVDNNAIRELKETLIVSKGKDHKSPLVSTTIKFYKLINNNFELQEKKK